MTHLTGFRHLRDCDPADLPSRITRTPPLIEWLEDAIYVPKRPGCTYDSDPDWGLYRDDGRLCDLGAYTRGLDRRLVGHSASTRFVEEHLAYAPDFLYIYCGPFYAHFGHFLTTTLPRFWLNIEQRNRVRFLVHGDYVPETWFASPFIGELMAALGLRADNFVILDAPCRIARVIVPEPVMSESGHIHSMYDSLSLRVTDAMALPEVGQQTTGPIYLSKSRLNSGVWRILEEEVIETTLSEAGVRIFHPQEHPVQTQIAQLEASSLVLGSAGSALHTSLLCRTPLSICAIMHSARVVENFLLIDHLKNNHARYIWPVNLINEGPDEYFQLNLRIPEIDQFAREYARLTVEAVS